MLDTSRSNNERFGERVWEYPETGEKKTILTIFKVLNVAPGEQVIAEKYCNNYPF